MTVYGFDVSHHQAFGGHFHDAKKQGYDFCMVKCTEGASYADPRYARFHHNARANGFLFAAYHFLDKGNDKAQAQNFYRHVGDKTATCMIDLEAHGATLADARRFRRALKRLGFKGNFLLYLPHWYWTRIGSPGLKGWEVVSSAYPSTRHDYGSALYPGAHGTGWVPYGGVTPIIWQFASTGKISGYDGNVDLDAYPGSLKGLKHAGIFRDYSKSASPVPPPPAPPEPPAQPEAEKVAEAVQVVFNAFPQDVQDAVKTAISGK